VPVDEALAALSLPAHPELTGERRIGVLLQHGFTGSPYSMKPWAQALAERGYAVEVPRLPGHGTTWREMNGTTWADWYGEASRAFDALCMDNDAVVVAGLSMGGALVLQLAADHPEKIAGLIVVNPAVATKRKDVKVLGIAKHLVGSFPAIGDDIKKPDTTEHAYDRTPLKAAHSMMQAWPGLVADLGNVTAPLLYFRSTTDHVVDEASEPLILAGVASRDVSVVRLENSYHVATLDNDLPLIVEGSAEFVARVTGTS
jgi:carboxylesterase